MEAQQIIRDFRREADDEVKPYFYKPEDVLFWLSEAEREAAVRARLIYDRSTSELARVTLEAGRVEYPLNPLWFDIDEVYLDRSTLLPGHRPRRLCRYDSRQIQGRDLYRQGANLHGYIIDGQKLTVFPVPDDGYTLYPSILLIGGYRLPLYDIESDDDEPEIPAVHHDGLVQWMLYRAFSRRDMETNNEAKAAQAFQLFEARFGERPSANALRMQAEGRRWTTRPATYP